MSDLNSERKRRRGLADTGMCKCGTHERLFCREFCMEEETSQQFGPLLRGLVTPQPKLKSVKTDGL